MRKFTRIGLVGFAALAAAMGIGRFAFTPVLPFMMSDHGVSIPQGALLGSSNYVGYLLGAVMVMAWPRHPRAALSMALVTVTVTTGLMALTADFIFWMVARMLAGAASAVVMIHASAFVLEHARQDGQRILAGIAYGGVGAGIAIAGFVAMLVHACGGDSDAIWAAFTVCGGAGMLVMIACRNVVPHDHAIAAVPGAVGKGWPRDAARLVICYGIFGLGYIIPATFLPVMARNAMSDAGLFGWVWPIFGVAAMTSTFLTSLYTAPDRARSTWAIAQAIMGVGILLPGVVDGGVAITLSAALVGGTFTVCTMKALQEARNVAEGRATALIALMTASFALGQAVGPLLASAIHRTSGSFGPALTLCGAAVLLSAAWLTTGAARAKRRHSKMRA